MFFHVGININKCGSKEFTSLSWFVCFLIQTYFVEVNIFFNCCPYCSLFIDNIMSKSFVILFWFFIIFLIFPKLNNLLMSKESVDKKFLPWKLSNTSIYLSFFSFYPNQLLLLVNLINICRFVTQHYIDFPSVWISRISKHANWLHGKESGNDQFRISCIILITISE